MGDVLLRGKAHSKRGETGKNMRSHARNVRRRAQRRAEAEERNERWRDRGVVERLLIVRSRRGASRREVARLIAEAQGPLISEVTNV